MEIRQSTPADLDAIAAIYDRILTEEEQGRATTGWQRGVYPTRDTARAMHEAGELFVMTDNGAVVAAARINQAQVPEYALAAWADDAPPAQVMVLHTLTVDPLRAGHGYGSAFVRYYEQYALAHGCPFLRMDTNARNTAARRLYAHLGYREAGIVPCCFNGIPGVQLVCLEKTLK